MHSVIVCTYLVNVGFSASLCQALRSKGRDVVVTGVFQSQAWPSADLHLSGLDERASGPTRSRGFCGKVGVVQRSGQVE